MAKHIGIIACSYEGAALCYKTICNEGSKTMGEHAHPEVSMHTFPLDRYMDYIYQDDWNGVAKLMASSAKKLVSVGVEILICPDNTIHKAYRMAKKEVETEWLHIAEEVAKEANRNGCKKIGILGTRYLMESPVYPEAFDIHQFEYTIPGKTQRNQINAIIFNELVYGIIKKESKDYFLNVIEEFRAKGCDSVVLGCTEIPLIVLPAESPLKTLDSTRILARAALQRAIG